MSTLVVETAPRYLERLGEMMVVLRLAGADFERSVPYRVSSNGSSHVEEVPPGVLRVELRLPNGDRRRASVNVPPSGESRVLFKLDDTPHEFSIGGRRVECYFSPSDAVTSKIISFVNAAQHSVAFELLTLTRSDIAAALMARDMAGVPVRGDLDNSTDTGSEYSNLFANGVDVKLKTGVSGLLHHKYCLVDAESPSWGAATLTGSHNWSSAAENSNNENTLIVHDFDVTNQYQQEFRARYHQFGGTDPIDVDVEQTDPVAPRRLALAQNAPNPFRDETTIDYAIPTAGQVVPRLYDVQGRERRTLVNGRQSAGHYRVRFSAGSLPSGVYFYRLELGGSVEQRKLLRVK